MHLLLLWFSMCSLGVRNNVSVVDVSQRCFFYFDWVRISHVIYPQICSKNQQSASTTCFCSPFVFITCSQCVISHYFFGEKKMKREMMWEICIFLWKTYNFEAFSKCFQSNLQSQSQIQTDTMFTSAKRKLKTAFYVRIKRSVCVSERWRENTNLINTFDNSLICFSVSRCK